MDIIITDLEGNNYEIDDLGNLPTQTQQKIAKVVKFLANYLEENDFYTDFVIDVQLDSFDFKTVVLNNSEDFSNFDRLTSDLEKFTNVFEEVERTDKEFILLHLA